MAEFRRSAAAIVATGAIIAAAVGGYVTRGSGDPVIVQLPNEQDEILEPDEAGDRIEHLSRALALLEQSVAKLEEDNLRLRAEISATKDKGNQGRAVDGIGQGEGSQGIPSTLAKVAEDDRFVVWSNETIEDKGRQIVWPLKMHENGVDWSTAQAFCENSIYGGISAWELPSPEEMQDLISTFRSGRGKSLINYINLQLPDGGGYWTNVVIGTKATWVSRWGDVGARDMSRRGLVIPVHRKNA